MEAKRRYSENSWPKLSDVKKNNKNKIKRKKERKNKGVPKRKDRNKFQESTPVGSQSSGVKKRLVSRKWKHWEEVLGFISEESGHERKDRLFLRTEGK